MSKENVEVAARIYEVWRTSKEEVSANLPRMMDSCHPEVEWSQREEGWTHRGRDGVRGRSNYGSKASTRVRGAADRRLWWR
jgi:hypothetical protein